jgi:hypothetical protein
MRDGLYEELEAVLDLKDTMEDYYSNTLSKLKEKYDSLRSAMSSNLDVIEHLQNILSLSGRGQNFAATRTLLAAGAQISYDNLGVSTAYYNEQKKLEEDR